MRQRSPTLLIGAGRIDMVKMAVVDLTKRTLCHRADSMEAWRTNDLDMIRQQTFIEHIMGSASLSELISQATVICTRYLSAVTRSRSSELCRLESHCPVSVMLLVPFALFRKTGFDASLSGTSGVGDAMSGVLPAWSTSNNMPTRKDATSSHGSASPELW